MIMLIKLDFFFLMFCSEGTKKLANGTNLINDIKPDLNVSAET